MLKTFSRLALLAATLAATSLCRAQQPAKPAPTAAELKKNLATIEAGREEDVSDLVETTARKLVTYLKTHKLSAAAAKSLGLELTADSKDAAHLKVYTFYFDSGGTRGTVHRFVVQWQNAAGQLFAYAVQEEGEFGEVYKLTSPGRTQYLLLGGDKGDSQCYGNRAYVVELKGNYLLLDKPAFGKEPLLLLCNVDMTFDARRQVLHLDLSDYKGIIDDELRLKECGYHRKPGAKSMSLQFSGGHFVQNR